MKKLIISLLAVMMLASGLLVAAPYYENGSQIFTISAGTNVPIYASNATTGAVGPGEGNTNFTVGGYGSIDYEVFLHPYISIGGELGYQFNFISDGNVFSFVPILFKVSYVPLQGNIEIPISLGVGLNFLSFGGASQICMTTQLTTGFRYFFTDEWGMGLNFGINYTPELYSDSSKNGMISFVPINLTVSYRH